MSNFLQNLFNGVTIGMVYFLIAAGMSIVLGIMGVTNLGHGAIYMIGAYVGWTVAVQLDFNYYVALIVGGLAATAVGIIMERGFLRYLYKLPNEQVLVTFGFVLVLSNVVLWIWGGRVRMQFTAPELMGTIDVAGVSLAKTRIFILVLGLVLALILWYLQDRTPLGARVRAGMDDKEMVMGLGINLPLLSAAVFALACFLGGLGGVMGSAIIGPDPSMGTSILLIALIVTIVGGVGSIQGALLGGVVIGVLDTFGKALFPSFGLFTMYLVMVAILLVKPSGLLGQKGELMALEQVETSKTEVRARIRGRASFSSIGTLAACAVLLLVLPYFLPDFAQLIMTKFLIMSIFAMGYNIVYGYGGMLSLGHGAFFGLGAYTAGLFVLHTTITSFWVLLPIAVIAGAVGAAILSFFYLRVSGTYFLLITFGLSQLLWAVAWSIKWFNSTGMQGITGIKLPTLGFPFTWSNLRYYYVVFGFFLICYYLIKRLIDSPFGHGLVGVREGEARMRAYGYNVWSFKYIALVLSGAFCGLAGFLFAYNNSFVHPSHLGFDYSWWPMLMVILGGAGTRLGPIVGAGIVVWLDYLFSQITPQRWPLILGSIFIAVIMYFRGGVVAYVNKLLQKVGKHELMAD